MGSALLSEIAHRRASSGNVIAGPAAWSHDSHGRACSDALVLAAATAVRFAQAGVGADRTAA